MRWVGLLIPILQMGNLGLEICNLCKVKDLASWEPEIQIQAHQAPKPIPVPSESQPPRTDTQPSTLNVAATVAALELGIYLKVTLVLYYPVAHGWLDRCYLPQSTCPLAELEGNFEHGGLEMPRVTWWVIGCTPSPSPRPLPTVT